MERSAAAQSTPAAEAQSSSPADITSHLRLGGPRNETAGTQTGTVPLGVVPWQRYSGVALSKRVTLIILAKEKRKEEEDEPDAGKNGWVV